MGGVILSVINYPLVRFVLFRCLVPVGVLGGTWSVVSPCLVIVEMTVTFGSSMIVGLSLA